MEDAPFTSEAEVRIRDGEIHFKAGELTEDDLKRAGPLIPVFGMDLVKLIFQNDWHLRERGLLEI